MFRIAVLLISVLALTAPPATGQIGVLGIECEQFQFHGGWSPVRANEGSRYFEVLEADGAADWPAATAIDITAAGSYRLWARTIDSPNAGHFMVSVGGRPNSKPLGQTGKAEWGWERGDLFTVSKGPVLLAIRDDSQEHHGRVDALILSRDPDYIPAGTLSDQGIARAELIALDAGEEPSVPISPVVDGGTGVTLASLENGYVRVRFIPATRAGKASARPVMEIRGASGWMTAPLDASAESYQVLEARDETEMALPWRHFHPQWRYSKVVTAAAGGASVKTSQTANRVIWDAGTSEEAIVREVRQAGKHRIELEFYPVTAGSLRAAWELTPDARTVRVEMIFTPKAGGQYSLGYHLFNRKPLAEVDELLMPMLVQRKRFPSTEYTMLQAAAPTPVSLMQTKGPDGPLTWGVAADPAMIPFEFPVPIRSRFGLHIRNTEGNVQPSIYGPLAGTEIARAKAGEPVKFALRIMVEPGDWYAAYRTAADKIFGWRDYRKNGTVSMTDAALNMIDLYMDDEYGGWWERARAPYQIESRNGSTQSTPITAVSLYRLTGDAEIYRRRTLPTLEFMLSRTESHFSPIPEDTGHYPKGSMNGPAGIFGTATNAGLWEIMNRRTTVFREIGLPEEGIIGANNKPDLGRHIQPFDHWIGRYCITGDKTALDRAIRGAEEYIEKMADTPPTRELGLPPFWLIQFTPAWEGLLRLYEVTKEQRFLDAAAEGGRLNMTGMWTQPTPAAGDVTIHPGGVCHGDKLNMLLAKGGERFRLGWPVKPGDTPEKRVPAWLVSNAGMGFEQPSTYTYLEQGGRIIFQAPWASAFLRLALYTGDKQFETYARNAVVGRWGNYPGYYYTTFTDLAQNPRYPYVGPDMGFFYYHHLLVHLSWTLDYLVSDAALLSGGAIHFPALRQLGYAYFDNLVYGHEPGEVLGDKDVWLWVRRGLVELDNPQINYLTAHSADKFYVILMNQSPETERVNVTFRSEKISGGGEFAKARILAGGGELSLVNGAASVSVGPRGLTVLRVDGLDIKVPTHRVLPEPGPSSHPGFVKVASDAGMEVRGAAIQFEPGPWQAYVWSTAASGDLKEIRLNWSAGGKTGEIVDTDYPYEFDVPVPAGETAFTFRTNGIRKDGREFQTSEAALGVSN